jgi:beta-N-acetylhexosaminidase
VAVNEVVRAVQRGEIAESRINQSVEKVLLAKTTLGLHRRRTVKVEAISSAVASPESEEMAQQMADSSMTLVKDQAKLLPVNPVRPPKIFSLVLSGDLDSAPLAVFQSELRRRFPTATAMAIDPRTPPDLLASVSGRIADSELIICSSLVRVISSKGHVNMPESHRAIIDRLLASGKPLVWVAFGNPYILRLYPQMPAYLCAYSYADTSQVAAAKALSGEIPITGRLPISIPGAARVGDGLQVPRLEMGLKEVPPEGAGLDAASFQEIAKMLDSYVEQKAFPGAELMVGYRGALVFSKGAGRLDNTPQSAAVDQDTIYDLASLSKAIGTTSAAMMLYESGRLLLDVPVQDYLPELKGPNKEKVQVRNLLTHSAGLPAFLPLYKEASGYEPMLAKIAAVPLEYEPGSRVLYSDLGMILMGEIITRASGKTLDQFLSQALFAPLGMSSTEYRPSKNLMSRIAPTENDPWRKRIVRGEVHDENAYAMGGVSGHAGLFSSGRDLARFAQMILNGGMFDHRRYLNARTLQLFTSAQGPSSGAVRGLGWAKPTPTHWTGKTFSPSAVWHTGFTGTAIWIDPERQLFIILLTNRVHPTRENTKIDEARRAVAEAVVQAVDGKKPSVGSTGSRE